jgi:hypothetical protein
LIVSVVAITTSDSAITGRRPQGESRQGPSGGGGWVIPHCNRTRRYNFE